MKLINRCVIPPLFGINQWLPLIYCCRRHDFDFLTFSVSAGCDGGRHLRLTVVVLGLGFQATWFNRIERAVYLSRMDQFEMQVKDHVKESIREELGEDVVFGDEEDGHDE